MTHHTPASEPHGSSTILAAYESLTDTAKLRVVDALDVELRRSRNHAAREQLQQHRNQLDSNVDLVSRLFEFLTRVEPILLRDCADGLRPHFRPLSYRSVERAGPEAMFMALKQIQHELEHREHKQFAAEASDFLIELQAIINSRATT